MALKPDDGPSGRPQYQTSYDPTADHSSNIAPWATIKDLYPLIMAERPETLNDAADGWTALAEHLGTATHDVHHDYAKARSGWHSEAGHLFDDLVDNTTASLTDWHDAAVANANALQQLASTIAELQGTMIGLWREFDTQVAAFEQFHFGHLNKKLVNKALEDYTNKTKEQVLEPLNEAYHAAFIGTFAGGMFSGPTNGPTMAEALKALVKLNALPKAVEPGGGPGSLPAAPAVPAAVLRLPPAAPSPRPRNAAPPPLPRKPPAASDPPPDRAALPPAPPAPEPLPTPPPVGIPTRPDMPDAPRQPTADLPPAAPLERMPLTPQAFRSPPTVAEPPTSKAVAPPPVAEPEPVESAIPGRPSAPEVPSRPRGRGAADEPEAPRSAPRSPTPQLPGRGGKPHPARPGTPHGEDPDAPPPRRGGPALPGRNSKNRRPERNGPPNGPPDDDPPPNRLASPRDLLGIRDTKPRLRPGSAEVEQPALQRSTPLNGRFGAQPELADELALRALRPALNGRAGRAPGERQTDRRDLRTDVPRIDFVGDTDLFAPRPAVPPVIARPGEAEPIAVEQHALRPVLPKT